MENLNALSELGSLYLLWAQNLAILPSNLANLRQNEPD